MGIESTKTVRRSSATYMLGLKGVVLYGHESNEKLAELLYRERESIFENYDVVDDAYEGDESDNFKAGW